MATVATSCPYCNARVAVPEPILAGKRVLCARCGESFPFRTATPNHNEDATPLVTTESIAATTPTSPKRVSNGMIGIVIFGVMVVMASISLALALQTESFRRSQDQQLTKPPTLTIPLMLKIASNVWIIGLIFILLEIWKNRARTIDDVAFIRSNRFRWLVGVIGALAVVSITFSWWSNPIRRRNTEQPMEAATSPTYTLAPSKVESLGYLPPDTNVVAAIHVAEASRNPVAKDFLSQLRLGPVNFGTDGIERWTGLRWSDIRYLVIGLKLDDLLIPRVTLIVQTLQPFDGAKIQETLKAIRIPDAASKDRFRFKLNRSAVDLAMWCPPVGNILIVSLNPKDLDAVPRTPVAGVDHLSEPHRIILKERVSSSADLWLAGHSNNWEKTVLTWWLSSLSPREQATFKNVRTFALWVQLADEATIGIEFECTDDPTAQALKAYLSEGDKPLLKDAKIVQHQNWVSGQAHSLLASLLQLLSEQLKSAGKP